MVVWREKFVAFSIHFAATLAVGLVAATLIFFVWFPDPFHEMVGGSDLFMLIVGCDLALGPLISLVIYNSRKSRRELFLDYSLVAVLQLGSLLYGMSVSFNSRPIYIVFENDRLEVITANEIEDGDLQAATLPEFRTRPLWGPKLVATHVKPEDHREAVFQAAFEGKDISTRPKFFVPYDSQLEQIEVELEPFIKLEQEHPAARRFLGDQLGSGAESLASAKWLPVKHKNGFWIALFNGREPRPTHYLPLDPYRGR